MRHIEKLDNKYLFLFNWYLLLFVLPCGMFPIQYYIGTMGNPAFSPIPKTVLLLIPVLLLVCRSQEKKVRNIKYAYLLITAGILITAVFVIKNSDQYVNGYLWSLLLHCFKYGVLNSIGFTFLILSMKDGEIQSKILCLLSVILLWNGFFVAVFNWKWMLLIIALGILYIFEKQKYSNE